MEDKQSFNQVEVYILIGLIKMVLLENIIFSEIGKI